MGLMCLNLFQCINAHLERVNSKYSACIMQSYSTIGKKKKKIKNHTGLYIVFYLVCSVRLACVLKANARCPTRNIFVFFLPWPAGGALVHRLLLTQHRPQSAGKYSHLTS